MRYFLVLVFGAVIGSFLNVCIYRLPRKISVAWPNSFCPACGKPVKFYDNIPVLSYFLLRGKCRSCGAAIPLRYPVVEVLTPLVFLVLAHYFERPAEFFIYSFYAAVLITVVFIDLEHKLVPDVLVLPGIALGLAFSPALTGLKDSLLGILAGAGSIFLMGTAGELLFKRESVGGGDVKLMAMVGSVIGPRLVLLAFFLAPLTGSFYAVYLLAKGERYAEIPYAPYLAAGSFLSLIFGERILAFLGI